LDTRPGRYSWLRWLARSFLLMSVLVTSLWSLWIMHWSNDLLDGLTRWTYAMFLDGFPFIVIVVIIAWLWPVSGGTAAILVGPLLLFWAVPEFWVEKFSTYTLPYYFQCLLLIIGGILSIIWGRAQVSIGRKMAGALSSVRRSWFRWLPRGFLLLAAFYLFSLT
jgi:hypothetical protein